MHSIWVLVNLEHFGHWSPSPFLGVDRGDLWLWCRRQYERVRDWVVAVNLQFRRRHQLTDQVQRVRREIHPAQRAMAPHAGIVHQTPLKPSIRFLSADSAIVWPSATEALKPSIGCPKCSRPISELSGYKNRVASQGKYREIRVQLRVACAHPHRYNMVQPNMPGLERWLTAIPEL
jgi:hypothetical protein